MFSRPALQELSDHIKSAGCLTDKEGSWGVSMSLVSGIQAALKKPKQEVKTTSHLKVTEEPNGGTNRKTKRNEKV